MPAGRRRSTSTSPAAIPAGRSPAADYEALRTQIIAAFENLTDPANPGKQVVLKIFKKEELRNVDGTDALHPNRSGDVVVVFRPPYQFGRGARRARDRVLAVLRPARLPARPRRPRGNVNMHGTFIAAGPGIRDRRPDPGRARDRRRADDRVPDGHPRSAERPRRDPLRPAPSGGPAEGADDPQHQRLPRAAHAARGGGRHVAGGAEPDLRDRRGGVPQAVVRRCIAPRRRTARSRSPAATPSAARRRRSRTSSATSPASRS